MARGGKSTMDARARLKKEAYDRAMLETRAAQRRAEAEKAARDPPKD